MYTEAFKSWSITFRDIKSYILIHFQTRRFIAWVKRIVTPHIIKIL